MAKKKLSKHEESLFFQVNALGLPVPSREYQFHPERKWRFDFAWPAFQVAVEVEGGIWKQSRHTTGSGYEKDQEKYNNAVLRGWKVLKFTSGQIKSGMAINMIRDLLMKQVEIMEDAG